MTTALRNFPPQLEDALYSLAVTDRAPTATALDKLIKAYPDYAEDLVDIFVEMTMDSFVSDDSTLSVIVEKTSPAVSRAMSRFNNRLHEVRSGLSAQGPVATARNIFLSYTRGELEALAKEMNATLLFVIKLRDRVIDPATVSVGFKRMVAEKSKATLDEVMAHLSGPQVVHTASFYKSDQKPQVLRQQPFDEAIRQSGLTQPQQKYLLSL